MRWSGRTQPGLLAHPRAGGDGVICSRHDCDAAGSPPRRRGRLVRSCGRAPGQGLTPAQAGTAASGNRSDAAARAHPRAGGDGRVPRQPKHTEAGLTPAQAGTARSRTVTDHVTRAHPRAGGDGCCSRPFTAWIMGSPPRRRGRPLEAGGGHGPGGLTPAQAGTACWGCRRGRASGAHPRAGGDGRAVTVLRASDTGSPPRRRGRQMRENRIGLRVGLTPAQAGTAWIHALRRLGVGAHPRAGGDGSVRHRNGCRAGGSPPRRRGRHGHRGVAAVC